MPNGAEQAAADFAEACSGGSRKLAPSEVVDLVVYAGPRGWHVHSMEAWRVCGDREIPELGKGIYGLRHIEVPAVPDALNKLATELVHEAIQDGGDYVFQIWLSDDRSS